MAEAYRGDNLIFIISQPRAGSTLLQRILGGHPDVVISSEPWLLLHPVYGLRDAGIMTDYSQDWAVQGVTEFLDNYTDGRNVYDDGIRAFAHAIYGNAIAKGGGRLFVDKTPRYSLILDDLLRLFPDAKFVFLLRNPMSVLASITNTQIQDDLYSLERFTEELLLAPRNMLNAIRRIGSSAIGLRYEELVTEPDKHIRELCDQLGIDFRDGMVDYADTPAVTGHMQDRTGIQNHDRPSDERRESWRQMLGDAQQTNFGLGYLRDLGRDTFEDLGYSFDELNDEFRQAAERHRKGRVLLPWKIAKLHPQELRGIDQMRVAWYRNARDYGVVQAWFRTAGEFIVSFCRSLRFTFGSAGR